MAIQLTKGKMDLSLSHLDTCRQVGPLSALQAQGRQPKGLHSKPETRTIAVNPRALSAGGGPHQGRTSRPRCLWGGAVQAGGQHCLLPAEQVMSKVRNVPMLEHLAYSTVLL